MHVRTAVKQNFNRMRSASLELAYWNAIWGRSVMGDGLMLSQDVSQSALDHRSWILGGGASAMQEQSPGGGCGVSFLYVQLSQLDTNSLFDLTHLALANPESDSNQARPGQAKAQLVLGHFLTPISMNIQTYTWSIKYGLFTKLKLQLENNL